MREADRAIERVIQTIWERYGEQLTIDDMARAAAYAKSYLTRVFQQTTGLTPGRFLSAVRLQMAKQLLTSTSLKVTDISNMVGYAGFGSFSSRFGYSVGIPPSKYRVLGGCLPWELVEARRNAVGPCGTIRGHTCLPDNKRAQPIFVGLFPARIPQGRPVRCMVQHGPGQYLLEHVPEGTWYLMACAEHAAEFVADRAPFANGPVPFRPDQALAVGIVGPIVVRPASVWPADVRLRPMRVLDPPVLPALPNLHLEAPATRVGCAA
jgi:AraC family transcriptional regulator